MSINHWPSAERPREKLLLHGAKILSDAELLAIFFRTGVSGKSAVDLAREVLQQFSDIRQLLDCGYEEFIQIRGLGDAKYVLLQAALEIGKRYWHTTLQRQDILHSPQETKYYLTTRLRDYPYEVFACLFVDSKYRLIHYQELFTGTINEAVVHPRIVVTQALKHNAAALIVAHNHPSGDATPSEADCELTIRLSKALELVDIKLLDHLVVGDNKIVSLAELGILG